MTKQTPLNLTDVEQLILKAYSLHKTNPIEEKIAKDYLLNSNTKKKKKNSKTLKKKKKRKNSTRRHQQKTK